MLGRFRLTTRAKSVSVTGTLARAAPLASRFHSSASVRATATGRQAVNRSVVAQEAFGLAIEDAARRGDFQTMLRLGTALNRARLKPNVGILNSVIGGFARANERGSAFKYFFSMKELRLDPTVDTFNAILAMWAKHGDVQNLLLWLRALRRNQTLPNRDTIRACRHAFMVRGKMNNEFTSLKDAKMLKRLLSITPDVVAQVKSTHASNVFERTQRRAKWLQEVAASEGKNKSKSPSTDAASEAAAAAASAAAEQAAMSEILAGAGKSGKDGKLSKAEKKAKADKAAAAKAIADALEAERVALSKVRSNPKWDPIIAAVEQMHANNSAAAIGIPDATDSLANPRRVERKKTHPKNPESYAEAATRAFVEMTRPVGIRRAAIALTMAEKRQAAALKKEANIQKMIDAQIAKQQKLAAATATATSTATATA